MSSLSDALLKKNLIWKKSGETCKCREIYAASLKAVDGISAFTFQVIQICINNYIYGKTVGILKKIYETQLTL